MSKPVLLALCFSWLLGNFKQSLFAQAAPDNSAQALLVTSGCSPCPQPPCSASIQPDNVNTGDETAVARLAQSQRRISWFITKGDELNFYCALCGQLKLLLFF